MTKSAKKTAAINSTLRSIELKCEDLGHATSRLFAILYDSQTKRFEFTNDSDEAVEALLYGNFAFILAPIARTSLESMLVGVPKSTKDKEVLEYMKKSIKDWVLIYSKKPRDPQFEKSRFFLHVCRSIVLAFSELVYDDREMNMVLRRIWTEVDRILTNSGSYQEIISDWRSR